MLPSPSIGYITKESCKVMPSKQKRPATGTQRTPFRMSEWFLLLIAVLVMMPAIAAPSASAHAASTDRTLTVSELTTQASARKSNTLSVKGNKVSVAYSARKNRTVKASEAFAVSGAKGKVTFKKISGNAKIAVKSNGTISVAKGLAKGSYKIRVAVKAAGNAHYAATTKKVSLAICVTAPKTVFIGDSRTVDMFRDLYGNETEPNIEKGVLVSDAQGDELWVALGGAAYNNNAYTSSTTGKGNGSFAETLLPRASEKIVPGDNVVILMGANDYGKNAADYVSLVKQYRKKKANWKATTVFFASVTPYGYSYDERDDKALLFNYALEEEVDAAGYRYIDAYTHMESHRDASCFRNRDAVHYTPEYNKMVYRYLIANIPAC